MLNKIYYTSLFILKNKKKVFTNIKDLKWFYKDYKTFKKQLENNNEFSFGKWYPVFKEKYSASGTAKGDYFHQDLLVANKIFLNNPKKHVDIGSRVDGFVAHVASFREIEVFDIRPLNNTIKNIKFIKMDATKFDNSYLNYTDSISCLHALEHFGLGRYNDPIDAFGHIKGFDVINKTLTKNGHFYFSVPIGKQRIEFNAHRIFSLYYLLNLFKNKYDIVSFSFVDDKGDLHENVELSESIINGNCNCIYGCGIFDLIKIN